MDKNWQSTEILDSGTGFHEAILIDKDTEASILVRLNGEEKAALETVRKINPLYSLASFYFDILLPGRIKAIKEGKVSSEKSEENNLTIPHFEEGDVCSEGPNINPKFVQKPQCNPEQWDPMIEL